MHRVRTVVRRARVGEGHSKLVCAAQLRCADVCAAHAGGAEPICEATSPYRSIISDSTSTASESCFGVVQQADAYLPRRARSGPCRPMGMRQSSLLRLPQDLELMGTWTARHELQLAAAATEVLERFGALGAGGARGAGPCQFARKRVA